jgi:hypothetical protein
VRYVRSQWWSDDGELLAMLGDALGSARDVPHAFIRAGKAVYRPPDLDAELAALIYDSECERADDTAREPALTRADTAALRALTFASSGLTIELEVTDGGLLGQVVPPEPAVVEVQVQDGTASQFAADRLGCFTVRPVPRVPFRLRCRIGSRVDVLTSWLSL